MSIIAVSTRGNPSDRKAFGFALNCDANVDNWTDGSETNWLVSVLTYSGACRCVTYSKAMQHGREERRARWAERYFCCQKHD